MNNEYCLTDKLFIDKLLRHHGFTFSKSLGQNFIVNPDICPKIADSLPLSGAGIIEIGTGIGVLTAELAKRAKKVVAVELDRTLFPILDDTLKAYNNIKIIQGDILKVDLNKIIEEEFDGLDVYISGNLPYYITSPIIMKIFESHTRAVAMSVMVQKEAGERLCAAPGTRDCGAVSYVVSYYSEPELLFCVDKKSFVPSPNVDSAVIRLKIRQFPCVFPTDEKFFFNLIKAAFSQRRKTLINSVSSVLKLDKHLIASSLSEISVDTSVRAERMTLSDFSELADLILQKIHT